MAASYCADCGDPLVAGKPFCPGCGAAVAAAGGEGAPAAQPPGAAPTAPVPAPAIPPTPVFPTVVGVLIGLALVGTVGFYALREDPDAAKFLDRAEERIAAIITPSPPIGDLTPVRDLRGTWKSSLTGKGYQVYGSFDDDGGKVTVYQEGDVQLVIESVSGNTASGTMRLTNVYGYSKASIPGQGSVTTPRTLIMKDSGACPISIRVSGTRLDFGSFDLGTASGTMQGSYTTDLIKATMTVQTQYGPIKGEFHLMRQK